MKKIVTLAIVHDDEKILLGLKKRGFGAGRWNGFGGKVNDGETIEQAAHRELHEEAGIISEDLRKRGVINFLFQDNGEELEVHLFSANAFSGDIIESDEMRPRWFLHSEIPYSEMWADDPHWLPLVLSGKNVNGTFEFDNPESQSILNKIIEAYE